MHMSFPAPSARLLLPGLALLALWMSRPAQAQQPAATPAVTPAVTPAPVPQATPAPAADAERTPGIDPAGSPPLSAPAGGARTDDSPPLTATPPPRVAPGTAPVPTPATPPASVQAPAPPAGSGPAYPTAAPRPDATPVIMDMAPPPGQQPATQETTLYAPQVTPTPPEPTVQVQFPSNQVGEILTFYEMLTGKRLVRDANLAGPMLTILAPGEIPRSEAVRLIEASLLLNGYTFVPVDDKTLKILGPGKIARQEGVPLYTSPYLLPESDAVVSYFMKLNYIAPQDAVTVFENTVQRHNYAVFVAVPNVQGVVITENVPTIRKLIALQSLIDVPPAQVVSEFIVLKRADAEKVVEVLQNLFENRRQGTTGSPAVPAGPPGGAPPGQPPAVPASLSIGGALGTQFESSLVVGETQLVADPRTNRILVVTRPINLPYIRKLIDQLDSPVALDTILERPLQFVKATDVLPVLADILSEGDDQAAGATGAQQRPAGQQQQQQQQQQQRMTQPGFGQGVGGTGGGMMRAGSIAATEELPPESLIVGKTKLIADNAANSILVIGPPDTRIKVNQLLNLLDVRPRQVYLAAVIGELRLTDDLEFGFSYFLRFRGTPGEGRTSGIASSIINSIAGTNLPLPRNLNVPGAFPGLAGLTVYGTIADSVDIYARALESTGKFKVLSRPVVYTTNNKVAVISSGQQVPYTSSTQSTIVSGAPDATTSGVTASIQYIPAELRLEVRPLINPNRDITLEIKQSNNNVLGFETFGGGNRAPIISSQLLETVVTVPDGSTVVIGGLIIEDATADDSGVPFLMRIPILGYLFKETKRTTNRRELLILIQPKVVETDGEGFLASWEERYRSKLGDEAYAAAAPSAFADTPVMFNAQPEMPDQDIRRPTNPLRPAGWTYQEYAPTPTPSPTPRRKRTTVPTR